MTKRKHGTTENASFKAHRNGLHRQRMPRFLGTKGLHQKLVKNMYYARLGNKTAGDASE